MRLMDMDAEAFFDALAHHHRQGDDGHGEKYGPTLPVRGAWGFSPPDAGLRTDAGKASPVIPISEAWLDGPGAVSFNWTLLTGSVPMTSTSKVAAIVRGSRNSAQAPVRIYLIPAWGLCVPVNASYITAQIQIINGDPGTILQPIVGISRGAPLREWIDDFNGSANGILSLGGAGSRTLTPPTYARRVRITVLTGAITTPTAVAAGADVVLPASDYLVTAGGAGATFLLAWELVSA